jgi:hypothetical protein
MTQVRFFSVFSSRRHRKNYDFSLPQGLDEVTRSGTDDGGVPRIGISVRRQIDGEIPQKTGNTGLAPILNLG